jgi:predicted amidohydrolase
MSLPPEVSEALGDLRAGSIAVAQTCPVQGDVPANVDEHLRLARAAAAEGAQVVVYPELSLTGYEIGLAGGLAFSEDDSRLASLRDAAASHSLTLIVGAPVRIGARLHIGAFILRPDRAVDLYTKHYLGAFSQRASCDGTVPPAESTVFQAGDRDPLVRFGGHLAAVAVCADIGRSSHSQRAAERGADTYLASMFVIPSDFDREIARLRRYAEQHAMMVAFANFGGPSGGLASAGRSAIWSRAGELLAQLPAHGTGVAVVSETDRGRQVRSVTLAD